MSDDQIGSTKDIDFEQEMMLRNNKTVRDVCAEIRIHKYLTALTDRDVVAWRDRILSAYEREMEAKDAEVARLKVELKDYPELKYQYEQSVIDGNRKTMEISDMTVRIDLLERALKPVMSVNMNMGANYTDMFFAVREAQRVMREGGEK